MSSYYDGDLTAALMEVETSVYKLYFAFKKAGYLEDNAEKIMNVFVNVIINEVFRQERKESKNEDQY